MKPALRGLYAIADTGLLSDAGLQSAVHSVLEGGARLIQYRDKSGDPHRRRAQASALQTLCQRHGVPLIINDDVELALAVGAAGVHLGSDDEDLSTARAALGPDRLLGASCYNKLERAEAAAAAGADYLAFGSFFPSPTKPAAVRAQPELLMQARRFDRPLCAIGGITTENAPSLIEAGADLVAVIHAVFGAADPGAAARRFAALFA